MAGQRQVQAPAANEPDGQTEPKAAAYRMEGSNEVIPGERVAAQAGFASIIQANRPERRTDLIVHELDGEALIFDPRTANTHRLNGTALFIWNLCDGRRDRYGIAQAVAKKYETTLVEAKVHVDEFVIKLSSLELLRARPVTMDGHKTCRLVAAQSCDAGRTRKERR